MVPMYTKRCKCSHDDLSRWVVSDLGWEQTSAEGKGEYLEYLRSRGISILTLDAFNLMYDGPACGLPLPRIHNMALVVISCPTVVRSMVPYDGSHPPRGPPLGGV